MADFDLLVIERKPVQLKRAAEISSKLNIYAYDAYMIVVSEEYRCRWLTLDRGLKAAATRAGIKLMELEP